MRGLATTTLSTSTTPRATACSSSATWTASAGTARAGRRSNGSASRSTIESSAVLRDDGRTDKKARGRDAQVEFGGISHRHEGGRAVVGVEQRREERVAPAQVEEIHGLFQAERIESARRRTLVLDLAVTPADA